MTHNVIKVVSHHAHLSKMVSHSSSSISSSSNSQPVNVTPKKPRPTLLEAPVTPNANLKVLCSVMSPEIRRRQEAIRKLATAATTAAVSSSSCCSSGRSSALDLCSLADSTEDEKEINSTSKLENFESDQDEGLRIFKNSV